MFIVEQLANEISKKKKSPKGGAVANLEVFIYILYYILFTYTISYI
jgi:hypothetical protein